LFSVIFSESFLYSAILFSLPIVFAAFGALISNKAGILNINIEGSMSVAAVAGALISHFTGSWVFGLRFAVLAGVCMSMILAFASLKLKTDSVLSGIALNTLASGLCIFVLYTVLGVKGDSSGAPSAMIPSIEIPFLSGIPVIGRPVFAQNLLFYIAVAGIIAVTVMLNRTRLGLHIKAVGYNEEAAVSVSIEVNRTKIYALLICGVFTGLGGAFLSMAYLSYFSAGMVGGRGFIGLAVEAMGGGIPGLTVLFAFLFGTVDYFAVGAQAVLGVPYELLNTLPYMMTVLALILYALAKKRQENGFVGADIRKSRGR
jgi:simple sugar transport system permease protein